MNKLVDFFPCPIILIVAGRSLNRIINSTKNDKRFIVISQDNKNVCAARNIGAFSGNGKYLVFLDGDDEIGKTFCEYSIEFMEKDKNICISTGIFLRTYINGQTDVFYTHAAGMNSKNIRDFMRAELYVNQFPVTSVIRMNRFKRINGFKVGTEYTQEDWEMFNRYFYENVYENKILFLNNEYVVIMHMQKNSKTEVQNTNWGNTLNERLEMYNENPKIYEEFFSAEEIEKIKNCINF